MGRYDGLLCFGVSCVCFLVTAILWVVDMATHWRGSFGSMVNRCTESFLAVSSY